MMGADSKIEASQELLDQISAAMADLVACANEKQKGIDEIASIMADILKVIESRKSGVGVEDMIKAIKSIKIEPSINVNPTPINNIIQPSEVKIMDRMQCDYKLNLKYDSFDRITEATIKMIPQPVTVNQE